jgi:predicted RNA binding protein YcfA (HicA-like mRNA interferase family)
MSDVPSVSGKKVVKAFSRLGFEVRNVTGSHHNMKKAGHPFVLTIPVHKNEGSGKGNLARIDQGGWNYRG